MWNRATIKKESRAVLRGNYWRILAVTLLLLFLTNGMRLSTHIDNAAVYFIGGRFETPTNADIVNDWYASIREAGMKGDSQILEYLGERYTPKKGVLAQFYNRMTADKSVLYGFLNALNDMMFKNHFGQGIIILLGAVLLLLFLIFIANVMQVGRCRFILEACSYRQTRFERILFPWRVKRWKNVSLIMFKKSLLLMLWDLTIIGGFIKRYSYQMVPYLAAENPDINHREVFRLSMQMMKGNKFRAFLLDLSFIGWYLLNLFTLGLLRYFFIQPYMEVAYGKLYLALRADALMRDPGMAQYMIDRNLCPGTGAVKYPVESYPLYNPEVKRWIRIHYDRKYSWQSLILMFFTFSFIGWLWEVSLHLFGDGVFVNRGFFHGPWLPIYGTGGVLVLVLLKRFAKKPWLTFLLAIVVCGAVEYFVGWFLWTTQKMYWWNYSGYFLNLHGRICAEGLIVFGLGSCAFIYILAPLFDELFRRIPRRAAAVICAILLTVFAADMVYSLINPNSGAGITDYEHAEVPLKNDYRKVTML